MAEIERQRKGANKATKPNNSRTSTASRVANGDADSDGVELLKRAVDRLVEQNCSKLSKLLYKKAETGSIGHMKLLITLAERKKPREKPVKKRRMTLAMSLAAEPQWKEPATVEGEPGVVPGLH